jgi:hypothetical protein
MKKYTEKVKKSRKVSPIKSEYIMKLKVLRQTSGKIPLQTEFVKAKLGTPYTILKQFGGWDNFVKEAKLEKTPEVVYEIDEDMKNLREIMITLNLDPCISKNKPNYDPLARLIFCNVLIIKYPTIRTDKQEYGKNRPDSNMIRLYKFLDCRARQTVYHNLRENALVSIKGYKDYEDRYKIIKSGFLGDNKYLKILELHKIRDESQAEATRLLSIILKETTL